MDKQNKSMEELTKVAIYSAIFMVLLIPVCPTYLMNVCVGIILGLFAGILNAILTELKRIGK